MEFPNIDDYWAENDADESVWEIVYSVLLSEEDKKLLRVSNPEDIEHLALSLFVRPENNFKVTQIEWELRFKDGAAEQYRSLKSMFSDDANNEFFETIYNFVDRVINWVESYDGDPDVIRWK